MNVEYINPFVRSLSRTFRTMLDCEVNRTALSLKENFSPRFEVSGVIGLSGKAVGTVVLSLSREVALKAASTMLQAEAPDINADVIDAVGELTNMVAGAAKAELEQYELSVSLPSVVTGRNHTVRFPSSVPPICVHFDSGWGPLTLEVGLAPILESVAATV